jgi:hypothetical protein
LKTLTIAGKQLDLPDFMCTVSFAMIGLIEMSPDISERVICCGIDETDNSLILITGTSDVRKITPNGYMKPRMARPGKTGKTIELAFVGIDEVFKIESKVALKNSVSCMSHASLFLHNNYVCDVDMTSSESFSEVNERDDASKTCDKRRSRKNH